jgi:hypothetical protein
MQAVDEGYFWAWQSIAQACNTIIGCNTVIGVNAGTEALNQGYVRSLMIKLETFPLCVWLNLRHFLCVYDQTWDISFVCMIKLETFFLCVWSNLRHFLCVYDHTWDISFVCMIKLETFPLCVWSNLRHFLVCMITHICKDMRKWSGQSSMLPKNDQVD